MKERTRVISFSGKGGTGKTTTASLFIRAAKELGLCQEILVIDADPDANLATTLNVKYNGTIAEALDKRKKNLDDGVPGEKLRADMYDVICRGEYFDFLVMGRKKGSGCYCAVNSILDNIIAETMNLYDLVVIDFDAGLEHFSRGTGSNNDTLLVVCDQSKLSFETAERITSMVEELRLPYAYQYLIGCRYDDSNKDRLRQTAEKLKMEVLGFVDYDQTIAELNLAGESIAGLGSESLVFESVKQMVFKILKKDKM